ncbi:MAG: membrane-bound lytic murein transglycosylase MltF [Sulfuriferula sp.]
MRNLLALSFSLLLVSCDVTLPKLPPPVAPVSKTGELVVLTHNGPTTYYENPYGEAAGFEHDLVTLFAKEAGYRVKFLVEDNMDNLFKKLAQHQAHFAAAGITQTDALKERMRFGPPYFKVTQQVIYNTNSIKPRDFADLVGRRVAVVAGSSGAETMLDMRQRIPGLKWAEVKTEWGDELLDKLARSEVDAVIVNSNQFDIAQNLYTNLAVAFDIKHPDQLAWAFPKSVDPALYAKVQAFFKHIQTDGTLKRLTDRYYGHTDRLENADVAGILARMNDTLPKYLKYFHEAEAATGIDWRLIAAVGYQESHWNPYATSPTGVRGLMMMTGDTADRMGVTDRLDPRQSIVAGAKYLALLIDAMPDRVEEPDKTWMALAAYNQGQGHLEDARVLAQQRKLSPLSWTDIKQTMPLLSRSEYNRNAKHGYCRGGEAVIFVENIRTYYDILVKYQRPYKPLLLSRNETGM